MSPIPLGWTSVAWWRSSAAVSGKEFPFLCHGSLAGWGLLEMAWQRRPPGQDLVTGRAWLSIVLSWFLKSVLEHRVVKEHQKWGAEGSAEPELSCEVGPSQ